MHNKNLKSSLTPFIPHVKVKSLALTPFITKSQDDTVRDLIFQGYVVPYRVNQKNDKIEIIGIFSENEWEA